jgi:hypothetical protein
MTYSYLQNKTKNLLSIGSQEATIIPSIQYNHLYQKSWLFGFLPKQFRLLFNLRIFRKNYEINGFNWHQKSVIYSKNTSWDIFYELQSKKTKLGRNIIKTVLEPLFLATKKITLNGEVSFYQNKFEGNEFSAVGFQMLEGLQTGQNLT